MSTERFPSYWSVWVFTTLTISGLAFMYVNNTVFRYGSGYVETDPVRSMLAGSHLLGTELIVAHLLLWPRRIAHVWTRATLLVVVSCAWTFMLLLGAMHAPGWYHGHVWWLIAVNSIGICVLLGKGFASLASKFRRLN